MIEVILRLLAKSSLQQLLLLPLFATIKARVMNTNNKEHFITDNYLCGACVDITIMLISIYG